MTHIKRIDEMNNLNIPTIDGYVYDDWKNEVRNMLRKTNNFKYYENDEFCEYVANVTWGYAANEEAPSLKAALDDFLKDIDGEWDKFDRDLFDERNFL